MMSFDESGYILYPRTSQTQQVPAYNFQVSIPGWRSSVPKYPTLPNDTRDRGVPRRPTDAKSIVARKGEIWTIFSETDERFNTVRDEIIQPHTRHLPRSALEYHSLPISSGGLGNRRTEREYCRVAIVRASD
jgi:hypothetical protein